MEHDVNKPAKGKSEKRTFSLLARILIYGLLLISFVFAVYVFTDRHETQAVLTYCSECAEESHSIWESCAVTKICSGCNKKKRAVS